MEGNIVVEFWQNSGSEFMGQNVVNESSEKHGDEDDFLHL